MVTKLLVLVGCCLALVLGVKGVLNSRKATVDWKDRYTIGNQAKRAKSEGKTTITIPGPFIDYPGENISLDEAIRDYNIVVAEPVAQKSYASNAHSITTWYKFRTLESLSRKDQVFCSTCPPLPDPPAEMAPQSAEEFLVVISGGTVMVEGVEVTMTDSGIPHFQKNQKYVLFLSIDPSGVARLAGGPAGIYRMEHDGSLEGTKKKRQMNADLSSRFDPTLLNLKTFLKN
jgi:hypothetical protein